MTNLEIYQLILLAITIVSGIVVYLAVHRKKKPS